MSEQHHPQGAPDPASGHSPVGIDNFFTSIRRMGVFRSNDRWVGGVASGIAERFGIDPLVVRGIFFVAFLLSGTGLVLYGIGWAMLPERTDGRIHLQQAIRGQFDIAMLGALAMVVVGLSSGNHLLSWWDMIGLGWINGLLWIAALAAIAWMVVTTAQKKGKHPTPSGAPTPTPPPNPTVYPAPAAPAWTAAPWTAPADAPVSDEPQQHYPAPAPVDSARPASPKAPKPPKTARTQGPGSVLIGIVVGLSLLAGAALLVVDRVTNRGEPLFIAWAGILVLLAGLGIVIAGLRGRRSGALGVLAIVGLAIGIPAAGSWSNADWSNRDWSREQIVMSGTQTITDPTVAEKGLAVGFGSPTYDLTNLDLTGASTADPIRIPIELGAGSADIIVPDGVGVQATVNLGAGHIEWTLDGAHRSVRGPDANTTFSSQEADDDGALLVLDVQVGAGNLTITEG